MKPVSPFCKRCTLTYPHLLPLPPQANPYDRVDLNPHSPWPPTQHPDDSAWEDEGEVEEGGSSPPQGPSKAGAAGMGLLAPGRRSSGPPGMAPLCWPAVVAAAGFWAPAAPTAAGGGGGRFPGMAAPPPPALAAVVAEGAAAEQSLLQPRTLPQDGSDSGAAAGGAPGFGAGLGAAMGLGRALSGGQAGSEAGDGEGGESEEQRRLALQRRRSALLSLLHTAEDAAALRVRGVGRSESAEEVLRRAGADPGEQLACVDVQLGLCRELVGEMGSSLEQDEALWAQLVQQEQQQQQEGVVAGGGRGDGTWLYGTPRGRTALLARLEYKRVLAQAEDVLLEYRGAVEQVMREGRGQGQGGRKGAVGAASLLPSWLWRG